MFGANVTHRPRARLQTFGFSDDKMLGHAGFKPVLRVAAGQGLAVSHELRHHRILGRDELDDNIGLEAREPGDQLRERDVPSDRQMVNERQRQDQIRTRPRLQCLTLLAPGAASAGYDPGDPINEDDAITATIKTGDLPPLDVLIESGKVLALNMPAGTNPAPSASC